MTEELNISTQLDQLIRLQDIDSEIFRIESEKAQKPTYIQELKDVLQTKKTGIEEAENNLKALQVKHKEKELELAGKEEEIKKLQTQLYQLKTNKEYTAMMTEIERHKADNSILEEDIIKLMDEIDSASGKVKEEKEKFEEESKRSNADIKIVEEEIKKLEDDISALKAKRGELVPLIDKNVLSEYDRILDSKDGLALAKVENDSCSGCYMLLPSQVINEIKMRDNIIYCESCRRMLYIKDEPDQT